MPFPELCYNRSADCAPKALFHDCHFADNVPGIAAAAPDCAAIPVDIEAGDGALPARLQPAPPAPPAPPAERPAAGYEDPVLIVYTSGTTGSPKGAVLTQGALRCTALMSQHAHDMTAADLVLDVLPLFHVGGLNIQPLPALLLGATLVILERFDPEAALRTIAEERISLVLVVPTVLQAMMAAPGWTETDLSGLRAIAIGSTDVPLDLIRRVHARDVPLIQVYGATETGPIAIYQRHRTGAFDRGIDRPLRPVVRYQAGRRERQGRGRGGSRRDLGARREHPPALLEQRGGDPAGDRRRLVPHRRCRPA